MSNDAGWELYDGSTIDGPFTEAAVVEAIGKGLRPTTMIRPVGRDDWKGLRSHAPFAFALESAATSVEPPRASAPPAMPAAVVPPPPAPSLPGVERVLLQEPLVLITTKRASLGETTYPIHHLTSVRVVEMPPSHVPLIVGVMVACNGLACLACLPSGAPLGPVQLIIGILLVVMQFAVFGPTFKVRVSAAGGEADVLKYDKAEDAQRVVKALTDAMLGR